MGFLDRLAHAWNAFVGNDKKKDEDELYYRPSLERVNYGYMSTYRPDRLHFTKGTERSIVTAIYNRIAIDVASIDIRHAKMDEKGRYV